jgi:hypothetical protein
MILRDGRLASERHSPLPLAEQRRREFSGHLEHSAHLRISREERELQHRGQVRAEMSLPQQQS